MNAEEKNDWMAVCRDEIIVALAKQLASDFDRDPVTDQLEPGNTPFDDGTECVDGQLHRAPAFFRWRQFVVKAKRLDEIMRRRYREYVQQHSDYATMMEQERTKIADYCRQLEKDIATLKPKS